MSQWSRSAGGRRHSGNTYDEIKDTRNAKDEENKACISHKIQATYKIPECSSSSVSVGKN